jgi:hypothetical protein
MTRHAISIWLRLSLPLKNSVRTLGFGGKTYPPGRYFAMQEIFAFVAVMLNRYGIQKQQGCRRFPKPDESSLTLCVPDRFQEKTCKCI